MHQVQVTILVNNQADAGLKGEHGLSLWIETEGKCILFDTGQGSALMPNAASLGVDLSRANMLVLSHGHFDHTGGVAGVLRLAPDIQIYCHTGILDTRYSIRKGKSTAIQIPPGSREAVKTVPAERIHGISREFWLGERVGLTGPIPRQNEFEDTGGPFFLDPQGKRPDPIQDDQALWIQTAAGLIICVGCSHAGLVNTIHYIRRLTQTQTVRAVIGGFHLINADSRRIRQTIEALKEIEPGVLIPCHCTGSSAVSALKEAFGHRVSPGACGQTFRF